MATGKATRRRHREPKIGVQVATADPFVLRLPRSASLRVSPAMFEQICGENSDLRLERTAEGRLVVMAPAGFRTGGRNGKLTMRLGNWAEADGTGVAGDSSTGYTLPNGAIREPDASWITQARLALVPVEKQEGFLPLCPDFVVELRSPTDRLKGVQRKMVEYLGQGARLGWLIDPIRQKVEVYRPGREPEVLDKPASLSGEDVLPGFVLDLRGILAD